MSYKQKITTLAIPFSLKRRFRSELKKREDKKKVKDATVEAITDYIAKSKRERGA